MAEPPQEPDARRPAPKPDDDWADVEPYVPSEAEREESARRSAQAQRWASMVAGVGSLVAAALVLLIVLVGGGESDYPEASYSVQSAAMEPGYEEGEEIEIDSSAYEQAEPELGDIVVYHPPRGAGVGDGVCEVEPPPGSPCPEAVHATDDGADFLGRVVATPGQQVAIRDGLPIVDGEKLFAEEMIPCEAPECDLPNPVEVSEAHYFLMGNDSAVSTDSRTWGPVWGEKIVARATE